MCVRSEWVGETPMSPEAEAPPSNSNQRNHPVLRDRGWQLGRWWALWKTFLTCRKSLIIGTLFCIFSGSIDSPVILMGRNYTAHWCKYKYRSEIKIQLNSVKRKFIKMWRKGFQIHLVKCWFVICRLICSLSNMWGRISNRVGFLRIFATKHSRGQR